MVSPLNGFSYKYPSTYFLVMLDTQHDERSGKTDQSGTTDQPSIDTSNSSTTSQLSPLTLQGSQSIILPPTTCEQLESTMPDVGEPQEDDKCFHALKDSQETSSNAVCSNQVTHACSADEQTKPDEPGDHLASSPEMDCCGAQNLVDESSTKEAQAHDCSMPQLEEAVAISNGHNISDVENTASELKPSGVHTTGSGECVSALNMTSPTSLVSAAMH